MFFKKELGAEYLVVGLGNPGKKYDLTRHNTGFMMLDYTADRLGVKISKLKFSSLWTNAKLGGVNVILQKPVTYMNLSGDAVGEIARYYKIPPDRVIIIHDDISLPVGKIRIRLKGSAGGHNGLKSIISHIGENFIRIKVGVGEKPSSDYDLADWVLSEFSKEEQDILSNEAENVFSAMTLIVQGEAEKAMNLYN
jgi:PTH1 family peptidyl-tRNA hydrolase